MFDPLLPNFLPLPAHASCLNSGTWAQPSTSLNWSAIATVIHRGRLVHLLAHSCWGVSYFILCYGFWQVPGQTAWANRTVHNGPVARRTVPFHGFFPSESSSRTALLSYCSLTPDASSSHIWRKTIMECRLWLCAGLPARHTRPCLLSTVQDNLYWIPGHIGWVDEGWLRWRMLHGMLGVIWCHGVLTVLGDEMETLRNVLCWLNFLCCSFGTLQPHETGPTLLGLFPFVENWLCVVHIAVLSVFCHNWERWKQECWLCGNNTSSTTHWPDNKKRLFILSFFEVVSHSIDCIPKD